MPGKTDQAESQSPGREAASEAVGSGKHFGNSGDVCTECFSVHSFQAKIGTSSLYAVQRGNRWKVGGRVRGFPLLLYILPHRVNFKTSIFAIKINVNTF